MHQIKSGSTLQQSPRVDPEDLEKTVRDLEFEIQKRMDAETALQKINAKLKEHSRHTLRALEADRRSVAKELHDSIGASLATIKFKLESLVGKLDTGSSIHRNDLCAIIQHLADTIKDSKQIATYLRPMMLDDFGLIITIGWLCRQFNRKQPNITIETRLQVAEKEIGNLLKIVCYRIIQEALTNTVKHGNADWIRISLWKYNNQLRLKIQDNGKGFDTSRVLSGEDPMSGNGLTGIRERTEIVGGFFTLNSRIGKGTTVEARFGLEKAI